MRMAGRSTMTRPTTGGAGASAREREVEVFPRGQRLHRPDRAAALQDVEGLLVRDPGVRILAGAHDGAPGPAVGRGLRQDLLQQVLRRGPVVAAVVADLQEVDRTERPDLLLDRLPAPELGVAGEEEP